MRKTLILLALIISVLPSSVVPSAHAAPPERWDVTIQASAPHNLDIWRGESLDFRPRFFSYGAPWAITTSATVTLYWSTNNFATAPWATNGTVLTTDTGRVSVTWEPACDSGASTYQYFVGVSEPSGLLYRARGTIRMQTSPGFTPSTAPLPVWDGWTNNYIYATYAAFLSLSNALVAAETASSNAVATATNALDVANGINATATNALAIATNANTQATNAQARVGILETNAVVKADTNGWVVSSHAGFLTDGSLYATAAQGVSGTNAQARVGILETNAVVKADTNGWVVSSHATLATVTQLDAATNAAVIDATNRVAGVGYLLPVSTQGLVTASITNGCVATNDTRYLAALTNAAAFSTPAQTEIARTNAVDPVFRSVGLTNAPTLQQVVTAGGSVTSGSVTIDSANTRTNTFGGKLTILGKSVCSDTSTILYPAGMFSAVALGHNNIADLGCTAIGWNTEALSLHSFAFGNDCIASNEGSMVMGRYAYGIDDASLTWNNAQSAAYYSHGAGTINLNPLGGTAGFYIGESPLSSLFDPAGTAATIGANLTTHTNRTDNPHSVTAAQVGAVPNNAAGIASAGGVTNGQTGVTLGGTFTATGGNVLTNNYSSPLTLATNLTVAGSLTVSNSATIGNLTISYSNDMLYFNIPLGTCTGIVWSIGGTNIIMKKVN